MQERMLTLAQPGQAREIFSIYTLAIKRLCEMGIDQWDEIYPTLVDIERDIQIGTMYVLQDPYPIAAVTLNADQDPTYAGISWRYAQGPVAVIHRLCVHPDVQKKGVGKLLVRESERLLSLQGYKTIRLDTFVDNPASNALYLALGYENAGEIQLRKGRFFVYEKQL